MADVPAVELENAVGLMREASQGIHAAIDVVAKWTLVDAGVGEVCDPLLSSLNGLRVAIESANEALAKAREAAHV